MNSIAGVETKSRPSSTDGDWVEAEASQVKSLRFWLVQVVVHNGQVVQIERTEKFRFDARPTAGD